MGNLASPREDPAAVEEDSSGTADVFTQKELERLGRERPQSLRTWYAEAGFVSVIVGSMMMSEYFISGFNILLPTITTSINLSESEKTWPAGVLNLTTGCLLMLFSRMCDQYGGRAVFLGGHAWLMVWSIVCGFSKNPIMLIVCRAMQGLGAAAFMPAGISLLAVAYRPGPRKNLVFGFYGAFACIGFYFGILIGGVCGQFLTWRWYFWIGGILVFVIVATGFLAIPTHLGDGDSSILIDWWGLATIVPGLILVVFAFTDGGHAPGGWRNPYIFVTFIVGLLFLAAAVYVEGWVATQPLVPAELFRPRYMKRLLLSLFCGYGAFGLYLFYASFYIEVIFHTSPMLSVAWFTPLAVGGMILAICGGLVLHIVSGRILMIISALGFIVSGLLFALMPARSPDGQPSLDVIYWAYVFPAMTCGTIGVDIAFNVSNIFITTSMPARLQATAGGLMNSVYYLGMAFWLGIGELATSTTASYRPSKSLEPREQYQIGFWVMAALGIVSLLLVVTINLGSAKSDQTADEKAEAEAQAQAQPQAQQVSEIEKTT